MKKVNYLLAAAAMVVGLASCNNDEEVIANANDTKVSLEINSVGLTDVETKYGIRNAAFSGSEELGVYINNGALGANYMSGSGAATITSNAKYSKSGSAWGSLKPIILSSTKGTVRAYYPYAEGNNSNDGTTIPVTILADQLTGQSEGNLDNGGQVDYMWATPVPNVSNAAPTIATLTMNHALAMFTFKFIEDTNVPYPSVGKVESIKLFSDGGATKKMLTGTFTMNIDNGALTADATADGGITVAPASATLKGVVAESELPRMLIAPVSGNIAADEWKVTIQVDGSKYTLGLPVAANGYAANNNYIFTFKMKGTALAITSVAIKPWTDNSVEGGTLVTPDQP